MEENKKLILIGYRATGKSSAGNMLAERLGVKFIDTDLLIERRAGRNISEIVNSNGWTTFRSMERAVLDEVVHTPGQAVISCGGGVVLHEEILGNLPPNVHTVCLTASVDTIVERIGNDSRSSALRPSLTGAESLKQEVEQVLSDREPMYRKFSQFEINTDSRDLRETVNELVDIWNRINTGQKQETQIEHSVEN